MTWLLQTVAGAGNPCLFVGASGTSKSVTIASYLLGLGAGCLPLNMNFSSRTSSRDVQHGIEDAIEKRTKVRCVLHPAAGWRWHVLSVHVHALQFSARWLVLLLCRTRTAHRSASDCCCL
jgi:hypothetical protein